MAFDVALARGQFPALSGEWIFMDNAGGTQVPFHVADAVRSFLVESNVQLGGTSEQARRAADTLAHARQVAAALIGAEPGEIVFGANASQLLRMIALVLSEIWDEGDEIIITQAEHEANVGAWEYLTQFGMTVKIWEIDPETHSFDVSRLMDLINDRTRMVAVHHGGNVLGNVLPVEEVVKLTKGSGAYLLVDGGQYVPHRLLDVKAIDADFYVFSAYKAFGPHVGVLYGKRDILEGLPRWSHFFVDEKQVPEKFELGTGCYEAMAGLTGLEKYLRAVGMSLQEPLRDVVKKVYAGIEAHERELTRELLEYLNAKPRVQVVGATDVRMLDERLPIVSFLVDDTDPQEFCQEVEKFKIGLRWGYFNSPRLLECLDLLQYKGVIRISLAHYNTREELQRLRRALDPLVS
jgi:cysteine desulfurase family protein (TIGR01976 family)